MTINWNQWNIDNASFIAGANAHQAAVNAYSGPGGDLPTYHENVAKFEQFMKHHSPEENLFMFMFFLMSAMDPTNNANILGLYNDQEDGVGKSMGVCAHTTQLINDLQNLFNDTAGVPESPAGNQLAVANAVVNQLISQFSNPSDPNYAAVTGSFDSNSLTAIVSQLTNIQTTLSSYFGPGATVAGSQIASFDQLKTLLGGQNDPQHSSEAAKGLTDAIQVLTSLGQNINSALNQEVNQITGMQKNWQSFLASLMKSILDELNAISQALGKAGS